MSESKTRIWFVVVIGLLVAGGIFGYTSALTNAPHPKRIGESLLDPSFSPASAWHPSYWACTYELGVSRFKFGWALKNEDLYRFASTCIGGVYGLVIAGGLSLFQRRRDPTGKIILGIAFLAMAIWHGYVVYVTAFNSWFIAVIFCPLFLGAAAAGVFLIKYRHARLARWARWAMLLTGLASVTVSVLLASYRSHYQYAGRRIPKDVQHIDAAVDQWAQEHGESNVFDATWDSTISLSKTNDRTTQPNSLPPADAVDSRAP